MNKLHSIEHSLVKRGIRAKLCEFNFPPVNVNYERDTVPFNSEEVSIVDKMELYWKEKHQHLPKPVLYFLYEEEKTRLHYLVCPKYYS